MICTNEWRTEDNVFILRGYYEGEPQKLDESTALKKPYHRFEFLWNGEKIGRQNENDPAGVIQMFYDFIQDYRYYFFNGYPVRN